MPELIEIKSNENLDYLAVFGLDQPSNRQLKFVIHDNASLNFKAIVLGSQDDEYELDLTMLHRGRRATSKADIRAVMSGRAKAKLTGLIKIEKSGSQAQAFLEERALLLSDNARVQAVPQLEIDTDDVQATHAAAVSKLSEEQLFYLQARGLRLDKARELIITSFLFGDIDQEIVTKLDGKLKQILANAEY